jgi:hypothetical protein
MAGLFPKLPVVVATVESVEFAEPPLNVPLEPPLAIPLPPENEPLPPEKLPPPE